ncbi:MAG: TauD/TfdA family dioxygenase [Pseudomonadota bacterium]|nr:TauD/TfdA family dioxygenase [Pseudomonadota bacterium]
MQTRPLMPNFGLEVSGVDLSSPIDDDSFAEILDLYFSHSALLFRDQDLSPQSQARLAHRFGRPKIETRKQFNLKDYPEVSTIGNAKHPDGEDAAFFVRGGFGWHTDGTSACHVDAATFLYAVEVPKVGGDTLLCSTVTAYENIPETLKDQLSDLEMLCSFHAHNDLLLEADPDSHIPLTKEERRALPPVWHKIVQVHPVTGRTVLYMNFNPIEFNSVSLSVGEEWLQEALAVATQEQFVYRHEWKPGDILIWDNHAVLHSGTPTACYESDRRLMHRSFVYTQPTERTLENLGEVNAIFLKT